ncbi:hypothetical protein FQZ97_805450 [compost metagenome]
MFVLVSEIAPQRVVGCLQTQRAKRQGLQPPGFEGGVVVVGRVFHMNLNASAQLPLVLVESGLEETRAQHAAQQPLRCDAAHVCQQAGHVDVGRAEQLQRTCGAAPFRQGRSLQHHRAGIGARHAQVGGVGAGVDPAALGRPAKAGGRVGLPARHGDHAVVHAQAQRGDEPVAKFTHGHAVSHGHGARAHKTLPALAQREAFNGSAGRVGPVQHPHRLAVLCGRLQHIAQRGDEGVDAAAEILQIDQQHVEAVHHRVGGAAHLAVEAEHRQPQARVEVVGRLDHVVLFVAAQTVLRAEGGGELQVGQGGEGIERMREPARDRGRVGQQGDPPAGQGGAQGGVFDEAFDAEFHAVSREAVGGSKRGGDRSRAKPSRWWKSGRVPGCRTAQ